MMTIVIVHVARITLNCIPRQLRARACSALLERQLNVVVKQTRPYHDACHPLATGHAYSWVEVRHVVAQADEPSTDKFQMFRERFVRRMIGSSRGSREVGAPWLSSVMTVAC